MMANFWMKSLRGGSSLSVQDAGISGIQDYETRAVQNNKVSVARDSEGAFAWRRFGTWLAATLVVCAMLCAYPGSTAYAWFNDVTDSYPASQDVPVSGSALTGADVPEGVYNITASSSSYMCKLSNVTLTSAGGGLWATFTMSGAYNALYPGTAEEAAASTNEDGTDVSAYYISDPLEGYVSRQFSIPIDALNQVMTLATYSGGSKGIDGGMWYTRTVVFNSSKEVDDAIAGGGDSQDEGGDIPSDDSGDSGDQGGSDQGDSGGDGSQDDSSYDDGSYDDGAADGGSLPDDSASTDEEGTDGSEDEEKESESESSSPAASNAPQGSTAGNTENTNNAIEEEGVGDSEEGEESSEAAASKEAAEADQAKGSGAKMREIKFAGNQVIEVDESDLPDQKQQEAEAKKVQNAGIVAAGVLGTLNVALVGAYVFGLKRARPKLFSDVAKKVSKFTRKNR